MGCPAGLLGKASAAPPLRPLTAIQEKVLKSHRGVGPEHVEALEGLMRKMTMTIAATACIAAASVAAPTKAEARCYGCWAGAAVAAGVIGSAIIANSAYGYGYYDGYGYDNGYAPVYGNGYYNGYAPAYYSYSYAPTYSYSYAYTPSYYGYAPHYYNPRRYYRPYRAYIGPRVYVRSYRPYYYW